MLSGFLIFCRQTSERVYRKMIYLLELSHVRDSERIHITIPFQTEQVVPFISNEFYHSFNPDQEMFLEHFSDPYIGLESRRKFPGFALKICKETLLHF